MESPFLFGKLVVGKTFVNRTKEIKALETNIDSGINTILISNRRLGKSSLVEHVAQKKNSSKIKFAILDLFSITSEKEFYQEFAKAVISASTTKVEQVFQGVTTFLGKLNPSISIGDEQAGGAINFGLTFNADQQAMEEVLDLPEKIALQKGIRLVVCLDEFQVLGNFKNAEQFQQKLRAKWQRQQNTTYILYGSKRHVLLSFFENKKMPFYKFGDLILLDKIKEEEWSAFIQKSFAKTNKKISRDVTKKIVEEINGQSYYVQQLAHETWLITEQEATQETVELAIENLIMKNDILYRREIEHLSPTQIGFLKALTKGEENFHSSPVIQTYNLGSSANVTSIKKALENKEVVDFLGKKPEFIDAGFKLWLKKKFFR